jgi:hypothetical protein
MSRYVECEDFIVPGAVLTVAVPRRGVSLVVLHDAACEVRHAADMGARTVDQDGHYAFAIAL